VERADNRLVHVSIALGMIALLLVGTSVYAADPPELPAGASAEIIEAKIREEARAEILRQPEPATFEMEREPDAIPAEEGIKLLLKTLEIRGSDLMSPGVFEALVADEDYRDLFDQYLNREVSLRDLSTLNSRLEQRLRARGFFAVVRTAAVNVATGEVMLEGLLSSMGELTIEGHRYTRTWRLRSYWDIAKGEVLLYDAIRKSVELMNANPDRVVRPILIAGARPGTTDVTLKVEETRPLHASFSLDNQGVKLTGKVRPGFMLRHNNLLGIDDVFLIGTNFGSEFGSLYLQHLIPLNSKGTSLNWGFSHAQVNPKKEFTDFGINGLSQSYSLSLRQSLHKSQAVQVNGYMGIDFKEKRTRVLSVTSVWDRLRVLSSGVDMQWTHHGGLTYVKQDVFLGFSPHGDGFALNSRGGESNFFKYKFAFQRQQLLPFSTRAVLRVEGQLTPDRLPPQEQVFYGGSATVRGYPESDYGADQGILASLEYWVPTPFVPKEWKMPFTQDPLKKQIQFFGFLDQGYGRVFRPSNSEERDRHLMGVGAGVEIRFKKNLTFRAAWGVPIAAVPLTETGKSQFHLQLRVEI